MRRLRCRFRRRIGELPCDSTPHDAAPTHRARPPGRGGLLHTQADERLVDLARAGNDRAFEAIVSGSGSSGSGSVTSGSGSGGSSGSGLSGGGSASPAAGER